MIGFLSLEFLCSIHECHVVFFPNSNKVKVRVRIWILEGYLNLVGLEGLPREKASPAVVVGARAAWGEAAVAPLSGQWGKVVGWGKG